MNDAAGENESGTNQWIKENRKAIKKDFITFVNFYNENKAELALNDAETEALRLLHGMWKIANNVYEVNFYFDMKNHHSVLNGKLLENSIWKTYIGNFMSFRVTLLRKTTLG